MLTLNKLEKVMELEEKLRGEYQTQLDEKAAEIQNLSKHKAELQGTVEAQDATIKQQLETITDLSSKTSNGQRLEQLNRELTNRADKQQDEIAELKKRVKGLQKDLAEVRAENKVLTQYDPLKMKKNLEANKKKLAEKTKGADLLQKSLSKSKNENAELQQKIAELEAKIAEMEPEEETQEETREEAAA